MRTRLACLITMVIAVSLVGVVPPVHAADPNPDPKATSKSSSRSTASLQALDNIISPGPLTSIGISPDLNCSVNLRDPERAAQLVLSSSGDGLETASMPLELRRVGRIGTGQVASDRSSPKKWCNSASSSRRIRSACE
jgi:hypothetical protein